MNTSERIKCIQEIAKRLEKEEYPFIDLLLRQFGLPWTDNWNGTKTGYVMSMIESESDERLLALADHLQIGISSVNVNLEVDCWRPGYFRLFLSHVSTHKGFAASLQSSLWKYAISGFVAHVDIEPTREWQDEIELALLTADTLVALMTPDFHSSKWTDQEIGICRGRGITIIPIRMGLDPYGFIGKYQALQGYQKEPEQLASELFDVLLKKGEVQGRIAQAVVNKFAQSQSFKHAKENLSLVMRIEHLMNEDLLNQLDIAVQNNKQISGSYGVPNTIKYLTDKVRNRT